MKPQKIENELVKLVKVTDEAIEKAIKRGDLGLIGRLVREQRHTLKALRRRPK